MTQVAKFKLQGDVLQTLSVQRVKEAVIPDENTPRGYIPPAKSEEWGTPPNLFIELDDEFHFDLDAAATAENTNCPRFYTKEQDALQLPWGRRVFCNPPYGHNVGEWVKKGHTEVMNGNAAVVVMLLKSTTDTRWWHVYVWDKTKDCFRPGVRVKFPEGRLHYEVNGSSAIPAPFASVVVIFEKPA